MEDDFATVPKDSLRFDLKRLLSAQQGITSEKITERKVSLCESYSLGYFSPFIFLEKCYSTVGAFGFEARLGAYQ